MRSSLRYLVVPLLVILVLGHTGTALSAWLASGTGSAYSQADIVPDGSTPSLDVDGRNVEVSWSETTLPDGTSADGYIVRRYDTSGFEQAVGPGCGETITSLLCVEVAVPPGAWRYAVTPKLQGWTGSESPEAQATVGFPRLNLDAPTSVAENDLPRTFTGTVENFIGFEGLTFHLDSPTGPALNATVDGDSTPAPVKENGTAAITVTVPAGTSVGPHSIYAVASPSGEYDSAAITVTTTGGLDPPVVDELIIASRPNNGKGFIKQDGRYFVYANITGVVDVATADVSSITTGQTTVQMSECTSICTVHGTTYGYRTDQIISDDPLAEATYTFWVTASNTAGSDSKSNTVNVDNTAPQPTGLLELNNGQGCEAGQGCVAERVDPGDQIIVNFTEALAVNTICTGWQNNEANQTSSVDVFFFDGTTGSNHDRMWVLPDASCGTFRFGEIGLGHHLQIQGGDRTFVGSVATWDATAFRLTITLSETCVGGCGTVGTPTATATYTPDPAVQDLAGNGITGTIQSEHKKHF